MLMYWKRQNITLNDQTTRNISYVHFKESNLIYKKFCQQGLVCMTAFELLSIYI